MYLSHMHIHHADASVLNFGVYMLCAHAIEGACGQTLLGLHWLHISNKPANEN